MVSVMNEASKAAQFLGRLNRGVPKHYSKEEIEKRTKRIVEAGKRYRENRSKK